MAVRHILAINGCGVRGCGVRGLVASIALDALQGEMAAAG